MVKYVVIAGIVGAAIVFFICAGKIRRKFVTECLYFSDVVDWLQAHQHLKAQSDSYVGFSSLKKNTDGLFRVSFGILNRDTSALIEGESITAKKVDAALEAQHRGKELVIYE